MFSQEKFINYISLSSYPFAPWENEWGLLASDRFLEHTRSDLVERLAGLENNAVSFLLSLPTFMCSEIDDDGRIYVKYGKIKSIKRSSRLVEFIFLPQIDFGFVEFGDSSAVAKAFGLNRFQPFRTHWAVLPGDADSILASLWEKRPSVLKVQKDPEVVQEPPEISVLGVADNVEKFLKYIFDATTSADVEYFFRGHEKAEYQLVPSVMREWKNGVPKYLANESLMAKELLISNYDEFQNDEFCFDRLVRMQHYGLPTRLLDLSSNPLIALFFACENALDDDGQVLIFGVDRSKIKYYDSDTVSCVANLSKLSDAERRNIDTALPLAEFNETGVIGQLWHHVRAEKPYFQLRINPEDIGSILCVKAKRNNSRIKSQHGAFLMFGHGAKMPSHGIDGISIQRITIRDKRTIMARLDSININSATVYPSIEKSAERVKKTFEVPEF